MTDAEKQKQANRLVLNNIKDNLYPTIKKMLEDNPKLLMDAENYQLNKKEQNKGIKNEDEWTEPEIYEFWSVSDWLYDKLKEKGEIVFKCLDFNVWGRQVTGRALRFTAVLREITEEEELEAEDIMESTDSLEEKEKKLNNLK